MFDSKDLHGRIDYMKKANSTRNISKGLGISPSTISRVLNHPELVKESTRVAVFDYLQKNNLELPRQNKVKTNTIGLTFSDPTSFFTSEVISALERNLVDTKYHLMLFNLRSRRDVYEYFMEHPEYLRKVDALIISSSTLSEKGSEFLQKLGIPVVLFHSQCPGERCILTNNFRGGRDAATFILSRGYKRIAFVGWEPFDEHIKERFDGFSSVVEVPEKYMVTDILSAAGGYKATERLLSLPEPPDAIFFACDAMAAGGMQYLMTHNIEIGKDLGIMGFDDLPIADLMGITSVTQFIDSEISMAVDYIKQRIEEPGKICSRDEISITPKVVIRNSLK